MLVLSVHEGENTTITTPDGETISIVMLSKNCPGNEVKIGIAAPDDYQILRHALRRQLQIELHNTPIYRVSSAQHPTLIVADTRQESASRHYQRHYPDSRNVSTELIKERYRHPWYPELETNWMRDPELPVSVEELEY